MPCGYGRSSGVALEYSLGYDSCFCGLLKRISPALLMPGDIALHRAQLLGECIDQRGLYTYGLAILYLSHR